nr:TOBE domain-containing protein [Marinifaba aquimaris]
MGKLNCFAVAHLSAALKAAIFVSEQEEQRIDFIGFRPEHIVIAESCANLAADNYVTAKVEQKRFSGTHSLLLVSLADWDELIFMLAPFDQNVAVGDEINIRFVKQKAIQF